MKQVVIKRISEGEQKYRGIGNYYTDKDGNRFFLVSDMNNWRYEFLVVLHALIERTLCKDRGVTDQDISQFKLEYRENRNPFANDIEPGSHPDSPYHKEHVFADKIERMVAEELNVNWHDYTKMLERLLTHKNEST